MTPVTEPSPVSTADEPARARPVLGFPFQAVPDGPVPLVLRLFVAFVAGALLAVIAAIDHAVATGDRAGPAYVLPVIVAVWFGGRWPGYVIAAASAVVWVALPRPDVFAANIRWDTLVGSLVLRGIVYTAVIEVLTTLRHAERRLRRAVDQRTAELQAHVAERTRAEASVRHLSAQLSAAEDAERRRVAYDIHDALSQTLGVVKLDLQQAMALLPTDTPGIDRIGDAVGTVDALIGQTRDLTFDLHPAMLDHYGLVPTLREFAAQYGRRATVTVDVSEVGRPPPTDQMPPAVVSYLFRATKELVNNAVRHGNAREAVVTVHWPAADGQPVRVVVDDDGNGFDSNSALVPRPGHGLGLAGIAERLAGLGGRLRVESQSGMGARAIAEVPVGPGVTDSASDGHAGV